MTIHHGWKHCPRCAGVLAPGDHHALSCASCGSSYYANSAPAVGVVLRRDDEAILLARRAVEPAKGLWDVPGGFLEEGEHPEAAVRRELREETGLEVEPTSFLGAYLDTYGSGPASTWVLNLVYSADSVGGDPTPADDVSELRWFGRDELPHGELAFDWLTRLFADLGPTADR
ncbi:MAG: NUDIX hydrolase [Gaiella sp.]